MNPTHPLLIIVWFAGILCGSTIVFENDSLRVHRIDAGSNAYLIESPDALYLVDAG